MTLLESQVPPAAQMGGGEREGIRVGRSLPWGPLDLRGPLSVKAQFSAVEISSLYLVNYLRNTHVFQGCVAWLFLMRLLASGNGIP